LLVTFSGLAPVNGREKGIAVSVAHERDLGERDAKGELELTDASAEMSKVKT
jgi:hypothetical protein